MQLKMCFLFGKILFGTCAHELDNLVLVNADSFTACLHHRTDKEATERLDLLLRPHLEAQDCKTVQVGVNECDRVAVSFSFLTNANLGLLSTEIARCYVGVAQN